MGSVPESAVGSVPESAVGSVPESVPAVAVLESALAAEVLALEDCRYHPLIKVVEDWAPSALLGQLPLREPRPKNLQKTSSVIPNAIDAI